MVPVQLSRPSHDEKRSGVVARFRWVDPSGLWRVDGKASRGERGSLVISHLEIGPEDPAKPAGSGVTGAMLRRIPTGDLLAFIRNATALETPPSHGTWAILADEGDVTPSRHGGRSPLPDSLLFRLSMAYLEETAPGMPPGVLARLAGRFERPEETISTWINRARKHGWLGPGTKGRAGAEPGPRLREAWREFVDDPNEIKTPLESELTSDGADDG